jgi:hypothetical protein
MGYLVFIILMRLFVRDVINKDKTTFEPNVASGERLSDPTEIQCGQKSVRKGFQNRKSTPSKPSSRRNSSSKHPWPKREIKNGLVPPIDITLITDITIATAKTANDEDQNMILTMNTNVDELQTLAIANPGIMRGTTDTTGTDMTGTGRIETDVIGTSATETEPTSTKDVASARIQSK